MYLVSPSHKPPSFMAFARLLRICHQQLTDDGGYITGHDAGPLRHGVDPCGTSLLTVRGQQQANLPVHQLHGDFEGVARTRCGAFSLPFVFHGRAAFHFSVHSREVPNYLTAPSRSQEGQKYGYDTEAFAIYDTIKYVNPPVHTVAVGTAWGEAAMLLASGEKVSRQLGYSSPRSFWRDNSAY